MGGISAQVDTPKGGSQSLGTQGDSREQGDTRREEDRQKGGDERRTRLYRTKNLVRQSQVGLGVGLGTRQLYLSGSSAAPRVPACLFRPLPWNASAEGGVRSRLSRKFDAGMVDMTCFARVSTLYKRKADKVMPQNVARKDGTRPGGEVFWKDKILDAEKEEQQGREPGRFDKWLIPRFSKAPVGTRLTPERKAKIPLGEELTEQERELFYECLSNREMALSWDFSEIGRIRPEVTPPLKIDTVDHKPWQAAGFPVAKALKGVVNEMLRERMRNDILEPCHGPYRNPWFLVRKKSGKYRLINSATNINKVTIKDANLPPSPDEFAEEFAGQVIGSYLDFFSGYDQLELDKISRDLTAIMTDLGLLRQCTLLQGATNSVAQFVRVVTKILQDHIPHISIPFLDDIGIKGPRSRYNDEEVPDLPGVRRFVLEHIQNLDVVLADLERAGATVSGEKSMFCMPGLKIVGYVCDCDGRHPDSTKVLKILEWRDCWDVTEARVFLGCCVYYRIWIPSFSIIAAPIYELFKKEVIFYWGKEQIEAMEVLKEALTTAPALMPISYEPGAGVIIAAFDASGAGWGAVLMQEDDQKRRHPSRYESGVWSASERNYDAGKRECKGLLKGLKKFRQYLFGVHFVIELDAKTLVAQLNRSASDLPGALVTRWIAWIQLFDFDVRHVPGKANMVADGLSRRPLGPLEEEDQDEEEIEDFIDAELSVVRAHFVPQTRRSITARACPFLVSEGDEDEEDVEGVSESEESESDVSEEELLDERGGEVWTPEEGERLRPGYSEESITIARYLTTLRKPPGMTTKEFQQFKRKALTFMVHEGHLFKRANKNVPLRRVVDIEEDRRKILKAAHEESGHRGKEGTYRRIADRYWWSDLAKLVAKHILTCKACQMRDGRRQEEALHPTWVAMMWQKVCLDIVYMPNVRGYKYLVIARDDLSGWIEGRPLKQKLAKHVGRFIWEDIICRFGLYGKLVVDGGRENMEFVKELTDKYGIKRIEISAYHPQANSVERGHQPIKDCLSKLANSGKGNWLENYHAAFWADRTTVRTPTGVSPFRFNYGYEPIMPIEEEVPSWSFLKWRDVQSTAELLALRTLQLQRRDEDHEEARLRLRRRREEGKEYFDATHVLHAAPLQEGDLVLLHNTMRHKDMSRVQKMRFKWLGPYRIKEAIPVKGTYILEELNGAVLGGTVAGNRLKRFHARPEVDADFAVPENLYSELPNRTSAGPDSWRSDASRSGDSEQEDSLGSESEGSVQEGASRRERFVGVFIPARV